MCLAIPAKILSIQKESGIVDYGGIKKKVVLSLIDHAVVGDYVLIHAGFAIEKLNKAKAINSLNIIKEDFSKIGNG